MRLPLLLPLLALALPAAVESALLAIDYGAEFTKLALVKPGVPIDIVLNKDSKRKVQSVVGWKKDERLFGSEAAAVVRVPFSYPSLRAAPLMSWRPSPPPSAVWPVSLRLVPLSQAAPWCPS